MADLREHLGRIVRDTWVEWAREQPGAKPSWLVSWDGPMDPGQRDVDMRIGAAIERAALKAAAEHILLLHDLSLGRACPRCHRQPAEGEPWRGQSYRCKNGHEWKPPLLVEGNAMRPEILLRLLARGEPLPDLPAKESDHA